MDGAAEVTAHAHELGPSLAELFVSTVGMIVGVFVVLCGALVVVRRFGHTWLGEKLVGLWHRNVTAPVTAWQRHVIQDRIEWLMSHENGGSSLKDLANTLRRLDDRFKEHVDASSADRAELHRRIDELLDHDAERDRPGLRYGPNPTNQEDT